MSCKFPSAVLSPAVRMFRFLPEELDEKVAKMHLQSPSAELTVTTCCQAQGILRILSVKGVDKQCMPQPGGHVTAGSLTIEHVEEFFAVVLRGGDYDTELSQGEDFCSFKRAWTA